MILNLYNEGIETMLHFVHAHGLLSFRILVLATLVFSARMFAADTTPPATPPGTTTPPAQCDCKGMSISVTRAAGKAGKNGVAPRAADTVTIQNFAYTNPNLTINVGDTVTWTNSDGAPHTATSDSPLFDTGTLTNGQSGSFTFTTPGTFPYHCSIHPFMTGTVVVQGAQVAPAITSPLTANAVVGTNFTYTLAASGTPAPTLSFSNVPAALQTNGATISGTFSAPGQFSIGLKASNAAGTDNQTLVLTVGTVPAITSSLTATATVGASFNYMLAATGSPTPTLSFSNVPPGFQSNGATLTGTFTSPGQVSIGLQASNVIGSDNQTLVVTVNPAGPGAMITSSLIDKVLVGASYSYTLTASGTPAPNVSFTNVPAALQSNGATISGTFNAPGQFAIGLHAANTGATDNQTLALTVGTLPSITSAKTGSILVGTPFNYTIVATGSPAPTLTFTNVPSGFTVNGAALSGTFASAGQFSIDIHAANTFGSDDSTLLLTAGTIPAVTSSLVATATAGSNFSYTLTASGSPAPALSFTGLPVGFQTNGATVSGIFSTAGPVTVGVHASNAFGNADSNLTITVNPQVIAPAITSPLTANAVVGADFSYIITASGTPTIAFSTGTLPGTLTLSGSTISGRFAVAGPATLTLTATNSVGSDTKTLVVTATATTEGLSGAWSGTLKGKQFSQTTGTPQSATDSKTMNISFTQVGSDLYAQLDFGGATTVALKGRIGMGNLWLNGKDSAQNTVTLSGHLDKTGKKIKGSGLTFSTANGEEFTFSLARK